MTLQTQRMLGAAIAGIAILALVIAAVVQPISEWGAWGIVVGFIALLFVMIGLLAVVSKSPTVLSGRRASGGSTTWTKVAIALLAVALVLMLVSGFMSGWTATTVLQLGIFAALECQMVGTLMWGRAS